MTMTPFLHKLIALTRKPQKTINYITALRRHPWIRLPESDIGGDVPTMLSVTERKMLHWIAREYPFEESKGSGCIVDAGAFLGGSTLALASGVARNAASGEGGVVTIRSYDMFIAPNDHYCLDLIGHGRRAGDSVLDLAQINLAAHAHMIKFYAGDFEEQPPPPGPIDILFVDIAKSWELNEAVIRNYFSRLIPVRSLVIQQDTHDQSCPWVNLTMEFFADYFEYLADDSASRVFLATKPIPPDVLATPLQQLPLEEKLRLMKACAARGTSSQIAFLDNVSTAWILFESVGLGEAIEYLDDLSQQQPWPGEPYVNHTKQAMEFLVDQRGFDRYIQDFFPKQ